MLASGAGAQADPEQALVYDERGCKGEDAASCGGLASALLTGRGAWPDHARAVAMLRTWCERDKLLCPMLARLYERGGPVKKDPNQARELYRLGCEQSPAPECTPYWVFLAQHGADAEVGRAATELEKECGAGKAHACEAAGHAHDAGRGIKKDPERAHALFAKACELGDLCRGSAHGARERGADARDIAELLGRACFEAGDYGACFELGTPDAIGRGLEQAEPECVAGDAEICELVRVQRTR